MHGFDWMAWALLIDSQDSGLLDLTPCLKQLMEAPLQTGMVKHKGCEAPRDYDSRRAQLISSQSRENWAASVQAELHFPACTARSPG